MIAPPWPSRLPAPARWCWWLGAACAGALSAARLAYALDGRQPLAAAVVETMGNGAAVAAGLAAWVRRPDSRVGALLLAWGALGLVTGLGAHAGGALLAIAYLCIPLYWTVLAQVLLTYPGGRAQTAAERRLLHGMYRSVPLLWTAVIIVAELSATPPCAGGSCLRDIGQLRAPGGLGTALWLLQKAVSVGFAAWFLVLVVVRWRRMSPAQRRTAGPVVWATSGPLGAFLLFATLDIAGVHSTAAWQAYRWLSQFTTFWVPLALLVGLLTTRLTRADVTDLLVRLRTATVDELRPALARLLRDPLLDIALPATGSGGYVDTQGEPVDPALDGRRVTTAIGHGALLLHHPSARTEDPQLFEAAISAVTMTLDNARLTAQVRAQLAEVNASRARLVEAAEQQRRRIERDLHDGAQQQLLGLGMSLQAARATVPDGSPTARYLDEATAQLRDSLAELRALSRGLRPALLAERGLGVALREVQRRATVPVNLAVNLTDRPDPAVETAAYFVVAEALQNAARHANQARVTVDVRQSGDRIEVTVCDDGPGGADERAGSGLRGLADRVAAAGGILTVASPPGRGTIVAARLPVTPR
jgi:signal transduction histidine kinase